MRDRGEKGAGRAVGMACVFALMTAAMACACALLTADSALAQFPQPAPADRPDPPAAPFNSIEGTVMRIDHMAGQVEVAAGLLGAFGRTVEVTRETLVYIRGRQRSLSDLHEGDRVRIAYRVRDGQNVATAIRVTGAPRRDSPSSRLQ